ncbi:unnamed protein product [Closterium sp. NIES-54]
MAEFWWCGAVPPYYKPIRDLFNGDAEPLTYQPLIGVLSQPGIADSGEIARVFNATEENHFANLSYIAASYVKFIEAGGARVVPIIYNEPRRQILKKLRLVNGLVLPGGDANKQGRFLRTVRRLLKLAMSFNDNGDYFPIYAECLSFEMLTIILSTGGRKVLEPTNAKRPSTLQFVGEWAKDRNMFAWMRRRLVDRLEKENLTMENHKYGLTPETFNADEGLSSFFNILTTTADEDGKVRVVVVVVVIAHASLLPILQSAMSFPVRPSRSRYCHMVTSTRYACASHSSTSIALPLCSHPPIDDSAIRSTPFIVQAKLYAFTSHSRPSAVPGLS